jgi:hypothetical protein
MVALQVRGSVRVYIIAPPEKMSIHWLRRKAAVINNNTLTLANYRSWPSRQCNTKGNEIVDDKTVIADEWKHSSLSIHA